MHNTILRQLEPSDCQVISDAFAEQGWNKPVAQYQTYYQEQTDGKLTILLAFYMSTFCGYLGINWSSKYPDFFNNSIPEIVDLNILIKYRNRKIATILMDEAERTISLKSDIAGIGVGLYCDYGIAQQMYVKRGYVPDGNGIFQNKEFLKYGDKVVVDDDLILCFKKNLR